MDEAAKKRELLVTRVGQLAYEEMCVEAIRQFSDASKACVECGYSMKEMTELLWVYYPKRQQR